MVAPVVCVNGPDPVVDGDDGACDGDNGGGDDVGLHTRWVCTPTFQVCREMGLHTNTQASTQAFRVIVRPWVCRS